MLFWTARIVGSPGLSYVRILGGREVRAGRPVGRSLSSSCELPVDTGDCDELSGVVSCRVIGTNSFAVGSSLCASD